MGVDMVYSNFDLTDWGTGARRVPGNAHHKWFFEKKGKDLMIIPKNYSILNTSRFHIVGWRGEAEMVFEWRGGFGAVVETDINIHKLIKTYEEFVDRNRPDLVFGKPLIFLDNPRHILKAYAKLIFKRRLR
jgi:hypothetical protein